MNLPNNTLLQGGKYKIVRFISNGGFGCTYEAEHTMLHKRVAIKEFFVKDFCNRDEQTSHVTVGTQTKVALVSKLRKKFVEEAVALSQFQHENIVRVSDVFEENGTAYYVMDFVNGRSLHEILKTESTIPESRAVKYICQVAHALRYVHAQNRLHLDIKPGNIMIDDRDNAVLIDFGTSKQYDEEAGENTSTLLGKTPGYAPIEQMGNSVQNFTPATDIYSLGATLYKMLTGITPPEANLLVSDDEALKPLPTYITPATRKAVEQAMQVKRKDRPQSIDELLDVWGLPEYTKDEQPMSEDSDESTLLIESDKTSSPETIPQTPETLEASPNKPNKKKSLIGIVATASILLLIVFIVCLSGNGKVEDEEPLLADTISIIEQPITVTDEIDLGLSVLWHSKNISADKGSENGTFYGYKDIKDANNNIVTNTLGNGWRIPTRKEWEELLTECSWEWTGDGYEVAASNGNKIFLPALGLNYKGNVDGEGAVCGYWSSTSCSYNGRYALFVEASGEYEWKSYQASFKFLVRPVKDKNGATNKTSTSNKKDVLSKQNDTPIVIDNLDEVPSYPGGQEGINRYLSESLIYPQEAIDECIQGIVVVDVVIEKDGSVCDVKVVKGVDPLLDAEAVRVVRGMRKWEPGKKNGKPVRTSSTVKVGFRLQ